MTTNADTGLPELAEGYFWRVYPSHSDSIFLRVSIFRREISTRRKGIFRPKDVEVVSETEVEWSVVYKTEASPAEILSTAQYVLGKLYEVSNDWSQYVGDYPPNKLGD